MVLPGEGNEGQQEGQHLDSTDEAGELFPEGLCGGKQKYTCLFKIFKSIDDIQVDAVKPSIYDLL